MNANEIKQNFLTLEPTHPFYRALLALVEADTDAEIDAATMPQLTDGARQFNAGRLAHARDLRRVIEGTMRDALEERQKEEGRRKKE
jgi:hypothetical protein